MIPADPTETRGGPVRSPGTARELRPIAEQVLAWVVTAKDATMRQAALDGDEDESYVQDELDDLRRIELCALATREAAMFFDLYGMGPHGHIDHQGGDPYGLDWKPQEC